MKTKFDTSTHPRPFKVKLVKEYSGDVPQMTSPYPEVGYWLDRYAVVDANGVELTRCVEKKAAEAIIKAMNAPRMQS